MGEESSSTDRWDSERVGSEKALRAEVLPQVALLRENAWSWGPHPEGCGPQLRSTRQRQAGTMFSAVGPFWPGAMSKVTF